MARLLAVILSSLAIAAATPLTSDISKHLSVRQLPECAGYGSVCRLDLTNRVNGTQGEFYTQDGDFCSCPQKQCSAVFVEDNNQRYDVSIHTSMQTFLCRLNTLTANLVRQKVYLAVATGGTSGIYVSPTHSG
ncbi:hypothetical protein TMatcc_001270 [Talaromyces marneffei ATCC 18224]